jgi:hypothetical protein
MHHDNLSINTITYKCVANKSQHFFTKIMPAGTLMIDSNLKVEKCSCTNWRATFDKFAGTNKLFTGMRTGWAKL